MQLSIQSIKIELCTIARKSGTDYAEQHLKVARTSYKFS